MSATRVPNAEQSLALETVALRKLSPDLVAPSPFQMRAQVDPDYVTELATSIAAQGQVDPIIVREGVFSYAGTARSYELIDGEQRWRAVMELGLGEVLARVVRCTDEAAELAVMATFIKRRLTTMERAFALRRAAQRGHTHAALAAANGMSRSRITNLIAITRLPEALHRHFDDDRLTAKHGEALLRLPPYLAVLIGDRAARNGWSVRRLEAEVEKAISPPSAQREDPNLANLARGLGEYLGSPVTITSKSGAGTVSITFASLEIFEGIVERMGYDGEDGR